MGWCCCSVEKDDFNKVSTVAHIEFSGQNGTSGKAGNFYQIFCRMCFTPIAECIKVGLE